MNQGKKSDKLGARGKNVSFCILNKMEKRRRMRSAKYEEVLMRSVRNT